MNGDLFPTPGGYLIAETVPRTPVWVHDPAGLHRIFRTRRQGVRFGVNRMCNGPIWTVCVTVDGTDYVVRPDWVRDRPILPLHEQPGGCTVIPFLGGKRIEVAS